MTDSHSRGSSSKTSQRFGPYQVGETIGRGTFAKVKIAVHETTKVRVALKIIPRKIMDNDGHSALKIKREIKVMSVLRHPHITRLYDVVQTKHDIVLVLEYISGGELFDFIIKRGKLDEATARVLFQQLSAAVAYCHRYRVAHRDIKPENIMMEHGTNNIKLSDFGLSSITHDGRFFETSCGTPNYASPEVVTGSLYGGPEADMWSCGVVLYAMVVGALPFDDTNVSSLFKKITVADYVMPRSLSHELQDLIRRMLVVNPLERATMEQVMQHPWLSPKFPPYLLSLHFEAALDGMRFARNHGVSEEMLDEEVVRAVATRFRMSPQRVASIVSAQEDRMPSMWAMGTEGQAAKTRRYPATRYWETFSNVLDAKLWPTPLEILPAEVALRDESHDVVVSYLIFLQKKQSKLGPEEFAKKSFGENGANLLYSQSQQGYGSLNANSLHQLSGNSSFTGSSFRDSFAGPSQPLQQQQQQQSGMSKKLTPTRDKAFFAIAGKQSEDEGAGGNDDDPWMDGYNTIAAPFLPLNSTKSNHTLIGGVFRVTELPVNLLKARHIDMLPVPRAQSAYQKLAQQTKAQGKQQQQQADTTGSTSFSSDNTSNNKNGGGRGSVTSNNNNNPSGNLLQPVSMTAYESSNTSTTDDRRRGRGGGPLGTLLRPYNAATAGRSRSNSATSSNSNGKLQEYELAAETALDVLYRVKVLTRFGNDFVRHGVLFRNCHPHDTLRATYAAMREEGLLWKVIYDYYFSAVRFPHTKLQVKVYKVSSTEQIVDVKVSVQSGMEAFDVAISLLERLRRKAVVAMRENPAARRASSQRPVDVVGSARRASQSPALVSPKSVGGNGCSAAGIAKTRSAR